MISVVADILKSKLADLPWIERFGGLVSQATRPELVQGADGVQVVKGYQTYPVACGVNMANCWENGIYKHFEPDSTKAAIAFFVDNGGMSLREYSGSKNSELRFTFDLKFLFWMNVPRLGDSVTAGGCMPSGRIIPYIISRFWGEHSAQGLFNGGLEEDVFKSVEVNDIRELTKVSSMFEPFTFARDGVTRGLFIYPYDFFGLNIKGTFTINRNCVPDYDVEWSGLADCISPNGGGPNINPWFDTQAKAWLDSLPEYDSNESALLDGLVVGEPYWAAFNHVAAAYGTFMRVTP